MEVDYTKPLLVTTPFGLGVKDEAWLRHRLILLSAITVPSLRAQSDQRFFWTIFVDADLPEEIRGTLEELLKPFGRRATLWTAPKYGPGSMLRVVDELELTTKDGMVLTGIIDDDDAWSTDVVNMVHRRVEAWSGRARGTRGVGITFDYGLEWLMYDMLDVDALQKRKQRIERRATIRPYRFRFLGTSVFVLSKRQEGVAALTRGHSRMEEFLDENGFDVDVVSTEEPMWLYCRHKQAGSAIQKSREQDLSVSIDSLARRFGIDAHLTREYIEHADRHGYGVVKRLWRRQAQVKRELDAVHAERLAADSDRVTQEELRRREVALRKELSAMTEGAVGDLSDI